jgi:hypothetical protein
MAARLRKTSRYEENATNESVCMGEGNSNTGELKGADVGKNVGYKDV